MKVAIELTAGACLIPFYLGLFYTYISSEGDEPYSRHTEAVSWCLYTFWLLRALAETPVDLRFALFMAPGFVLFLALLFTGHLGTAGATTRLICLGESLGITALIFFAGVRGFLQNRKIFVWAMIVAVVFTVFQFLIYRSSVRFRGNSLVAWQSLSFAVSAALFAYYGWLGADKFLFFIQIAGALFWIFVWSRCRTTVHSL